MATPARTAEARIPTAWGELLRMLVDGTSTHGAYSVAELSTPPPWRRATYVHHLADETFYVVAGGLSVVVDGAAPVLLAAGDALHVRRGSARSLARTGAGTGRLLVVQTPGGLLEQPASRLTAATTGIELVDQPC